MNSYLEWHECCHADTKARFFYHSPTQTAHTRITEDPCDLSKIEFFEIGDQGSVLGDCKYYARVLAPFISKGKGELSISTGEILIVKSKNVNGWSYAQRLDDGVGYVPSDFIRPILPQPNVDSDESIEKSTHRKFKERKRKSMLNKEKFEQFLVNRLPETEFYLNTAVDSEPILGSASNMGTMRKPNTGWKAYENQLRSFTNLYIYDIISRDEVSPREFWHIEALRIALDIGDEQFSDILSSITPSTRFKDAIKTLQIDRVNMDRFIQLRLCHKPINNPSPLKYTNDYKSMSKPLYSTGTGAKPKKGTSSDDKLSVGLMDSAQPLSPSSSSATPSRSSKPTPLVLSALLTPAATLSMTPLIGEGLNENFLDETPPRPPQIQTTKTITTDPVPQLTYNVGGTNAANQSDQSEMKPLNSDYLDLLAFGQPFADSQGILRPDTVSELGIPRPINTKYGISVSASSSASSTPGQRYGPGLFGYDGALSDSSESSALASPVYNASNDTHPSDQTYGQKGTVVVARSASTSARSSSEFASISTSQMERQVSATPSVRSIASPSSSMGLLLNDIAPSDRYIKNLSQYPYMNFASMYFRRQRRGLFAKADNLQSILSFSARIPITSLLSLSNNVVNDALMAERCVMKYMGNVNYESKDTDSSILQDIVYMCWSNKAIINEVFCYLFKQTSNNPDETNTRRGYEILYVLVQCMPPQDNLFNYFVNQIYGKINQANKIGGLCVGILLALFVCESRASELDSNLPRVVQSICSQLEVMYQCYVPSTYLNSTLLGIMSAELLSDVLLSHGISLPSDNSYGCKKAVQNSSQVSSSDTASNRMDSTLLDALSRGIVLRFRPSDHRSPKEKFIWISPNCIRLCWKSHKKGYEIKSIFVHEIREIEYIENPCTVRLNLSSFVPNSTSPPAISLVLEKMLERNAGHASLNFSFESPPEALRVVRFFERLIQWRRTRWPTMCRELEKNSPDAFYKIQSDTDIAPSLISFVTKVRSDFRQYALASAPAASSSVQSYQSLSAMTSPQNVNSGQQYSILGQAQSGGNQLKRADSCRAAETNSLSSSVSLNLNDLTLAGSSDSFGTNPFVANPFGSTTRSSLGLRNSSVSYATDPILPQPSIVNDSISRLSVVVGGAKSKFPPLSHTHNSAVADSPSETSSGHNTLRVIPPPSNFIQILFSHSPFVFPFEEKKLSLDQVTSFGEHVFYRFPRLLRLITDRLKDIFAFYVPGVFRESGNSETVTQCLNEISEGKYDIVKQMKGSKDLTSVFKKLLRELSSHVVPESHYFACVRLGQQDASPSACMSEVLTFPVIERDTFLFVCRLIATYAKYPENTLDTASFIVCMAPSIFRMPEGDMLVEQSNVNHCRSFMNKVIDYMTTTDPLLTELKEFD